MRLYGIGNPSPDQGVAVDEWQWDGKRSTSNDLALSRAPRRHLRTDDGRDGSSACQAERSKSLISCSLRCRASSRLRVGGNPVLYACCCSVRRMGMLDPLRSTANPTLLWPEQRTITTVPCEACTRTSPKPNWSSTSGKRRHWHAPKSEGRHSAPSMAGVRALSIDQACTHKTRGAQNHEDEGLREF